MNIRRPRFRDVPTLNTSSLPDLIFTVLFFFMIVTHMRKATLKVKYRAPQGTELTKLAKKSAVTYIYVGHPVSQTGQVRSGNYCVQMNDKYVSAGEVGDYVSAERDHMTAEDAQQMTVSIKADRATPMRLITNIKQSLRQAHALKVNYSATSKAKKHL